VKIAYLSTFYPYRGGIAHFNALMYRAFEKQQHDIKAFTFSRQYPQILFPGSTQYANPTDDADKVPAIRSLDTINPITYLTTAQKIWHFKPDILIMKYWMPFFAPSLGTVARLLKRKGTKTVAILDNIMPHEKRIGDQLFNNYFLTALDCAVVMSQTVERDLITLQPTTKYLFHPHPIYSHFGEKIDKQQARKQFNIPTESKVLLFFGLIRAYKGLDLLLETFANLPPDYYLIIAGEPYEDTQKYKTLISHNKNKDRIIFHDRYVPDNAVNTFFSAADVNILPYKTATQSGVLAISYHFDLPVIVTEVGSLHETVNQYQTGISIAYPDKALLLEAIQAFFDEPRQEFSKQISLFKERYTWESLASAIVSVVQ